MTTMLLDAMVNAEANTGAWAKVVVAFPATATAGWMGTAMAADLLEPPPGVQDRVTLAAPALVLPTPKIVPSPRLHRRVWPPESVSPETAQTVPYSTPPAADVTVADDVLAEVAEVPNGVVWS